MKIEKKVNLVMDRGTMMVVNTPHVATVVMKEYQKSSRSENGLLTSTLTKTGDSEKCNQQIG